MSEPESVLAAPKAGRRVAVAGWHATIEGVIVLIMAVLAIVTRPSPSHSLHNPGASSSL